jgi:hypothetical protein
LPKTCLVAKNEANKTCVSLFQLHKKNWSNPPKTLSVRFHHPGVKRDKKAFPSFDLKESFGSGTSAGTYLFCRVPTLAASLRVFFSLIFDSAAGSAGQPAVKGIVGRD